MAGQKCEEVFNNKWASKARWVEQHDQIATTKAGLLMRRMKKRERGGPGSGETSGSSATDCRDVKAGRGNYAEEEEDSPPASAEVWKVKSARRIQKSSKETQKSRAASPRNAMSHTRRSK